MQTNNTDINSIQFTQYQQETTPQAIDFVETASKQDFSEIINEEPLSQPPKVLSSLTIKNFKVVRNSSPQKLEGINQLNLFSNNIVDQDTENKSNFIPIFLHKSAKYKSSNKNLFNPQINIGNVSMSSEPDKSQVELTLMTEEQPIQSQLQNDLSQTQIELNRSRHLAVNFQQMRDTQKVRSSKNVADNKQEKTPIENYIKTSIQMGLIDDKNQGISRAENINISNDNNRKSKINQQQSTNSNNNEPQTGRLSKYNKLIKDFIQRQRQKRLKQQNSRVSQNHQEHSSDNSALFERVNAKVKKLVIKAAQQWKEYSRMWVLQQLDENAYKIINDKAYMTEQQIQQSEQLNTSLISKTRRRFNRKLATLYKSNKRKMKSCFQDIVLKWKTIKTIDPSSTILLYWDIIHIICIIFNIYYIIIEWVTGMRFKSTYGFPWVIAMIASLAIFSIDIILNFHKGFYYEGLCIYDKSKIARFYLTKYFFFDVCAIIPLIISIKEWDGFERILSVLILLKLQTVIYILSKYKDLYSTVSSSYYTSHIIYLIKLALTILFVAHIFSSFYLGLGLYIDRNKSYPLTWIQQRGIQQETWLVQYLYSFHWAVCTMTTVGYGDITPQNPMEVGYVIVTMFLACGFFGYTFNTIGQMVQEIQNRNKEFNEQMKLVNIFLQNNSVSNDLKLRIKKYFEFKRSFDRTEITKSQENEILEQLDEELKELVVQEIGVQKYKQIKDITNIFEPFTDKLKKQLHEIAEEVTITAEESKYPITQADNIEDFYDFYIVLNGKAKIYMKESNENKIDEQPGGGFQEAQQSEIVTNQDKKEIKYRQNQVPVHILQNKSYFGEISFFTNQPRKFTIKCDKNTKLLKISQKLFLDLVRTNEEDYETFCKMRDDMILNQNFNQVGSKCLACLKEGHDIVRCKYIHYNIDNYSFISRKHLQERYESESQKNQNNEFQRKRNKKFKFNQFMNYNNSISDRTPNQKSQPLLSKRQNKSASFKQAPSLTIKLNNEEKPDIREYQNLDFSDKMQEFKYYFPESNFSCVLLKILIFNFKKQKHTEFFNRQSDIQSVFDNFNYKRSAYSIFSTNFNKQNNRISNQPQKKFKSIKEIVDALKNNSKNYDQ